MKHAVEFGSDAMIYILSRVGDLCVTYETGSGLDDWIY
jgi:hypothetical protein